MSLRVPKIFRLFSWYTARSLASRSFTVLGMVPPTVLTVNAPGVRTSWVALGGFAAFANLSPSATPAVFGGSSGRVSLAVSGRLFLGGTAGFANLRPSSLASPWWWPSNPFVFSEILLTQGGSSGVSGLAASGTFRISATEVWLFSPSSDSRSGPFRDSLPEAWLPPWDLSFSDSPLLERSGDGESRYPL